MNEIEKATEPFNQHDTCDVCGKRSDGLTTCFYSDGETTKHCPECIEEDGSFCLRCGNFSAGIESFDFSEMPGYCIECVDEIKTDFGEFEDEGFEQDSPLDEIDPYEHDENGWVYP